MQHMLISPANSCNMQPTSSFFRDTASFLVFLRNLDDEWKSAFLKYCLINRFISKHFLLISNKINFHSCTKRHLFEKAKVFKIECYEKFDKAENSMSN